ncbi:hypothetical protein Y032_0173g398 [Ancylostoma ceylanicum]|uniref:Uncharacterized protein n=1 Tax=Ancylostoma ceylanicum TaxID=53326 RepID=A0A016SV41_9BILA|nr:hypothetical protein Y032_0173g398 [Ancylostoma ceylanicum]
MDLDTMADTPEKITSCGWPLPNPYRSSKEVPPSVSRIFSKDVAMSEKAANNNPMSAVNLRKSLIGALEI